MKTRTIILTLALMLPCLTATAQSENSYCKGLKNPTAFTITGANTANAQWYGYHGNKNAQVSQCGNWGMAFPENQRINANQLESFTSTVSQCQSANSVDIHGQQDYQQRFVIKGPGTDPLTYNHL